MTTSQLQTQPKAETVQATSLANDTGVEDDMVLAEGRQSYTLRATIAHMLYPHQREGIKWLWGLHTKGMGGILGDDMGLGKTMQVRFPLLVSCPPLIQNRLSGDKPFASLTILLSEIQS